MNKLRRTLQGVIAKISNENTVIVLVERKQAHPLYGKVVRTHKKYIAHAPNAAKLAEGMAVTIGEIRPVSKRKSWQVINVITE